MLQFVNLHDHKNTNVIKRVVKCVKTVKRKPKMIIVNTDYNGVLTQQLYGLLQQLGLIEQPTVFGHKTFNQIALGDYIVIGEENPYTTNFDFRVISDQSIIASLDKRTYRVLDLVSEWSTILTKLGDYGKIMINQNYGQMAQPCAKINVVVNQETEQRFQRPTLIDFTDDQRFARAEQAIQEATQVSYADLWRPTCSKLKATFFTDWVKIGMQQYRRQYDFFGRECINVDGTTLYVKKDRLGRDVLAVR